MPPRRLGGALRAGLDEPELLVGAERVAGREGADRVVGARDGAERVAGREGADRVVGARDGAERVAGREGADRVVVLRAGADRVDVPRLGTACRFGVRPDVPDGLARVTGTLVGATLVPGVRLEVGRVAGVRFVAPAGARVRGGVPSTLEGRGRVLPLVLVFPDGWLAPVEGRAPEVGARTVPERPRAPRALPEAFPPVLTRSEGRALAPARVRGGVTAGPFRFVPGRADGVAVLPVVGRAEGGVPRPVEGRGPTRGVSEGLPVVGRALPLPARVSVPEGRAVRRSSEPARAGAFDAPVAFPACGRRTAVRVVPVLGLSL
ncbi:MAG: hypothetical protein ACKVG4_12665 [Longimicrobiales bacterium]